MWMGLRPVFFEVVDRRRRAVGLERLKPFARAGLQSPRKLWGDGGNMFFYFLRRLLLSIHVPKFNAHVLIVGEP